MAFSVEYNQLIELLPVKLQRHKEIEKDASYQRWTLTGLKKHICKIHPATGYFARQPGSNHLRTG